MYYIINILFRDETKLQLGDSRKQAKKQLYSLEIKLDRNKYNMRILWQGMKD